MSHTKIASAVAVSIAALSLAACGERSSSNPAAIGPEASGANVAAALPPPPPTMATQHERAIKSAGGTITEQGLAVPLPAADFPGGKAEFKPEDPELLHQVAGLLKAREDLSLHVAAVPTDAADAKGAVKLAEQRAEAVEQYLVTQEKVADERIETRSLEDATAAAKATAAAAGTEASSVVSGAGVQLVLVDRNGTYRSTDVFGEHSNAQGVATEGAAGGG